MPTTSPDTCFLIVNKLLDKIKNDQARYIEEESSLEGVTPKTFELRAKLEILGEIESYIKNFPKR